MNDNLGVTIKKEIRRLQEEKRPIEEKIKRLEKMLEIYGTERANQSGPASVRSGTDIRPTIEEMFRGNGNVSMKKSEIVRKVKELMPDTDAKIVERKMAHAVRTRLEKTDEYGKYRLKPEFLGSG